jgi:prepilin-type N-terminal cleavage/methylation domain-containing protein
VVKAQRGYSLLEIVVALAVFGIFCAVLFTLTAEMRFHEKRLPINMHKNPQVISVLTRLRRDVLDAASGQPYLKTYGEYTSSDKVLILQTMVASGPLTPGVVPTVGQQTVIWDFRTPGEVRRIAYNVGVANEWVSRGLPVDFANLEIGALKTSPGSAWATRIEAKDGNGRRAIDTILQPRATQ